MPRMTPLCRSRSSRAAASMGSPSRLAQSAMPTCEVVMMEPLRYRAFMTSKSSERGLGEEPQPGGEAVLGDGDLKAADQVLAGGEDHLVPGLGAGAGQAGGEHGLADAGRADQDDVGGFADEPQRGQLADQVLISAGLGGEVVVVDRPGGGQGGEVQPGGELAGCGGVRFDG